MKTSIQDLRMACRILFKSPVFFATAVLTLALGIGANTAIFSVVNSVLLSPLPQVDPSTLMVLWETKEENRRIPISAANFLDWQERNQVFEELSIIQDIELNLIGGDEPERVTGVRVSPNFFNALRVTPAPGRGFLPNEDTPGEHRVAVLSHSFWQRRFAGDESLVGRTVRLETSEYTVVGIMPADFRWPLPGVVDIWIPRVFHPQELTEDARRARNFRAIGRLRAGVTMAQAQADMDRVAGQLESEYALANTGWGINVVPLLEQLVGNVRPTLLLLFGAVGLVLLVACANVANLMLARSTGRHRETALRLALGADRWQLARLWLSESLLVSLAGGTAGLLLAWAGMKALIALNPPNLPRLDEISLDLPVLLFTLLVSLVTGVLFSLVPVLNSGRVNPGQALKDGGAKSTVSPGQRRVQSLLVVIESALALVLLIGSGLLIHSFYLLRQVDPGFQTDGRQVFYISLSPAKYREGHQRAGFFEQIEERIENLPAVRSVGAVATLPLSGAVLRAYCFVEGQPPPEPGEEPTAGFDAVSSDYFKTMGVPLLQGRFFTPLDHAEAPAVLLVNETMAKKFFPGEDPLGKRVSYESPQGPWKTIVGVVADMKHRGLDAPARAEMYHPLVQDPFPFLNLVVWGDGEDSKELISAVRSAVWQVDEDQPIGSLGGLERVVSSSLAQQRFATYLFAIFAAVALLLGAVGIYGVVSYLVSQGTHEVGIRLALGAQRGRILRLMIARGLGPVLLGIVLGIFAAVTLKRVVAGMLYQVDALDPLTFLAISLLLAAVGLVASWIPARRALRVDPVVSLRHE